MKRHILRLLLVTAALGVALPALAAEDTRCGNPPRAKWLASKTVKDKLTAIGFDVRWIDMRKNCFRVKALDRTGGRVEMYVDPATAEVIKPVTEDKL